MTVTPLGRDQDCSLKNREPDVLALLVPGSWRLDKTAVVGLYFIFPGICTLSLVIVYQHKTVTWKRELKRKPQWNVTHWFAWLGLPRAPYLGMVLNIVGWAPPHQPANKRISYKHAQGQADEHNFLFQVKNVNFKEKFCNNNNNNANIWLLDFEDRHKKHFLRKKNEMDNCCNCVKMLVVYNWLHYYVTTKLHYVNCCAAS
ncbi:hypothetical protein STEG23_032218 [Scotinomys teguina]